MLARRSLHKYLFEPVSPETKFEHILQLWLTLANNYLQSLEVSWDEIRQSAFSDRPNPDDDKLGLQIIKDLHRTGWTGLNDEHERVLLKRVLLAYARYNKAIGYCQGFNVIAALILEVVEYKEEDALKVHRLFKINENYMLNIESAS